MHPAYRLRYALHHFSRQADVIGDVRRCLKPRGVFLYSDPAMPEHSRAATHGLYLVREETFTGYRTYHELTDLFLGAAFEILSVRPYAGQRGTFADYLSETPAVLKEHLQRGWSGLDDQTKQELKWAGRTDGPFITYPVVDVAARRA